MNDLFKYECKLKIILKTAVEVQLINSTGEYRIYALLKLKSDKIRIYL